MVERRQPPEVIPGRNWALRFVSGKYKGGEFPLEEGESIVVGRSSELDVVLVEEMISRKHARFELRGGVLTIEDVGSTNGTFVNGEKISKATLLEGDRVLLGTSILQVVTITPGDQAARAPRSPHLPETTSPEHKTLGRVESPRMSGDLEEIPLPDLLQLFGSSKKSGVLVLRTPTRTGVYYLEKGRIRHARILTREHLGTLKAAYRMLGWVVGKFSLEPPREVPGTSPVDVSVQEILMEGFRQQDEFGSIPGPVPALEATLVLPHPLEPPLSALDSSELDVLQSALNALDFESLLDASGSPAPDVARPVVSLIERGYLTVLKRDPA